MYPSGTDQSGFAPVVFNNQMVLEHDTSIISRSHCEPTCVSYGWGSHISKSQQQKP